MERESSYNPGSYTEISSETHRSEQKEQAREFFSTLKQALSEQGGAYFEDIHEFYRYCMQEGPFLIRREDPVLVLHTLGSGEDLMVQFCTPGSTPYANAAEWIPRKDANGLKTAFLEGRGHTQGVVTVVGFKEGRDLFVQEIPTAPEELRNVQRQQSVRGISGTIHPEDIRFVIVRVPADRFPVENMTEDELDEFEESEETKNSTSKKQLYIFRGFVFSSRHTSHKHVQQ